MLRPNKVFFLSSTAYGLPAYKNTFIILLLLGSPFLKCLFAILKMKQSRMMVTMIGMMMVSQTSTYGHVLSHHFLSWITGNGVHNLKGRINLFNRQQVDITDKKGEDVDEKQMNVFLDATDLKVSTAKSHNPGDGDVEDMVAGAGLQSVLSI